MTTAWSLGTRVGQAFPSGAYYRITHETGTFIEGEFQFTANRHIGTFGGEELQIKSGSFKAKKLIW